MESSASTIDQKVQQTLNRLEPLLKRTETNRRPVVLMTCGVAGSGKSTLSRALLARHPTFTRLSIDNIIATRHGLYGTDYAPSLYPSHQDEAASLFRSELIALLEAGEMDIVLDRAFYAKADREEFKQLVEQGGGRRVLVFLKVGREELWRRIEARRMGVRGPDSAREVGWELLGEFVEGFEVPRWEGEVVVDY